MSGGDDVFDVVVTGAAGDVVGARAKGLPDDATVAVTAEVPLGRLWHAVPSFPAVSEFWLALLEEYVL